MKRFWLVLLSLGLIMAFSVSAYAVDVKFSGSMFAAGMYLNRADLKDVSGLDGQSTAFYFQRMRVTTEFVVAPGLSLVTRANVMERIWGATRSTPGDTLDTDSAATRAENENIGFDYGYITYTSPIGIFSAGYQEEGTYGLLFGNQNTTAPKLSLYTPFGGGKWASLFQVVKLAEFSKSASNPGGAQADVDMDEYVAAIYHFEKNWNGGLLYAYINNATGRLNPGDAAYKEQVHVIEPYFSGKFGPVAIQSEVEYLFGKAQKFDTGVNPDVDVHALNIYIDAVGTFGMFYVGGTFAYVSGDDPTKTDKNSSYLITGGREWSPTLLMWNRDRAYWFGNVNGYASGTTTAAFGPEMTNAFFYQVRAGVKPVDKLDVCLAVSYANADEKPTVTWLEKDYGWEFDLTGTYKITNNLSYMLGVGYLLTGDYFKADNAANDVANDYMVINKLTLTF